MSLTAVIKWTNHNKYIDIKHIPQLTGHFWVSKIHKFDANLNRLWSSDGFGAFNSDLKLKDLDGNGDEEIITASGRLDYTKVNSILSHLDNQLQLFKQYENAGKGDDFEFLPPTLPSDILAAKVQVYGSSGAKLWDSNTIGMFISGVDVLDKINNTEEIAVAVNEMANLGVINNYVASWQGAVSDVLPKRDAWRTGSLTAFMSDLLPRIEQYNTWAAQWRRNGGQWGTRHDGYWGAINPERPDISYPSYLEMPDIIEPTEPSDDEINSIIDSKVQVYKWGTSSMSLSWQSPSLGHLLTNLITTNIDGTATPYLAGKEIAAAGVDLSPLFDDNDPKTTIHIFRSTAVSGVGTLTGKVTNSFGNPISGVRVEIFNNTQSIAAGTTSAGGTYSIVAAFSPQATYIVKASSGQHTATKTTTLWPQQMNYLDLQIMDYSQWILINGSTSATIAADDMATITANTTGRVNLYLYHDRGTSGVLDGEDVLIDAWFMDDGSFIDEDAAKYSIQQQRNIVFDDNILSGSFILKVVDEITGASSYASVVITETVLSQYICGQVTVGGQPAANVIVKAESYYENMAVMTDSNGMYRIYVSPRRWWLSALRLGHRGVNDDEDGSVYVEDGSHTIMNFDMKGDSGLVAISGQIKTPDGKPIPGALVEMWSKEKDTDIFGTIITDMNGSYAFYVLSGISYGMDARRDGYSREGKAVVMSPASGVDFVLIPYTATITGSVTDPNGEPISGADVYANWRRDGNLGGYSETMTNPTGRYLLYVSPSASNMYINAHAQGYARASIGSISAGAIDANIVLLPHNGTISGTVYSYGSAGTTTLSGVHLTASLSESNQGLCDYVNVYTHSDGSYVLSVLDGRAYNVFAYKEGYVSWYGTIATATAANVNIILTQSTPSSPLTITTTTLPQAEVGIGYKASLSATGGVPSYIWSVAMSPLWLTMGTSGVLSGTPTLAGSYTVIVKVKDSADNVATRTLSIIVNPQLCNSIAGTITYSGTKTGTAYVLYSTNLFTTSPSVGATFNVNGSGNYPFTLPVSVGTYSLMAWLDAELPYGIGTLPEQGDVVGLYEGTLTVIEGRAQITGTPTSIFVGSGSTIAGVNFSLNVAIPLIEGDLKINGMATATVVAGGTFTLTCNSSVGRRVDFHLFHDRGVIGVLEPTDPGVPCDIFEIDNSYSDENGTSGRIQRTVMAFGGSPIVAGRFILQAVDVTSGALSYASINFTPQDFGQSISGIVTLDGSPAANLIVVARSGSDKPEFISITDNSGEYTLSLPAGPWILKAYKIGYPSSDIREVYVSAGNSVTGVNFSLNTTGLSTITGQVMTGNKPLSGVMVRAENEKKDREVWMVTGTGGAYILQVSPDEIWTVMVEKNGYNSHPQAMSVHNLPASNVNFILSANTMPIIGTITGSGPIMGARVEGWCGGYSRVVAQTNSQGRYSLYVPGGSNRWKIKALAQGSAETVRSAYPGDMMINLNLQWHNGTISGKVYAPDGITGLGFAEVEALGGNGSMSSAFRGLTNLDGTYQLPVTNWWRYEVTAKKPNYGSPASQSVLIGSGTTPATATVNFVMLGADLWIDKWSGRASYVADTGTNLIYPGATFTYHIMYGNKGERTAGSVTIVDTLPLGVTLATSTANLPLTISTSGSQTVLTWQVGMLKPNEEGHFKLIVSASADTPASTTLTNIAQITTPEYEGTKGLRKNNLFNFYYLD